MKRLLILIWIMFLFLSCTNQKFKIKSVNAYESKLVFATGEIKTDNIFLPYVIEYFNEIDKYNIPIHKHVQDFDEIKVSILKPRRFGVTSLNTGNDITKINSNIIYNKPLLRLVVFHELSHKFLSNSEHCHDSCDAIMSRYVNVDILSKDWEEQKRILFRDLVNKHRISK